LASSLLYPENDPQGQLRATAFQHQLEKTGWAVGGNLQLNFHWGTGDADWVRSTTERALQQSPDVLLANDDAAMKAAQKATRTIPIIFIGGGDPVGDGLVQSFAHPGGNMTGFTVMEPSLGAKLLGMLKQVTPHVARVAVLMNPDTATHKRILALLEVAASDFSVKVVSASARQAADVEGGMMTGPSVPIERIVDLRVRTEGGECGLRRTSQLNRYQRDGRSSRVAHAEPAEEVYYVDATGERRRRLAFGLSGSARR
jgi:ABC transporter substrate binding protein